MSSKSRYLFLNFLLAGLATPAARANLIITPTFSTSIATNPNAAAIDSAIGAIEGLYGNSVNIPVTFTYSPGAAGNLESNTGLFYSESYTTYVSQLRADSAANPGNSVLATAIANLPDGNDANGSSQIALAAAQLTTLGVPGTGNAVVNLNSNQVFAFSRPVPSNEFDAIGGIEHELDEVLGGGGAGSISTTASPIPASSAANSDPPISTATRPLSPRATPLPQLHPRISQSTAA